jgi:hypothetical protein
MMMKFLAAVASVSMASAQLFGSGGGNFMNYAMMNNMNAPYGDPNHISMSGTVMPLQMMNGGFGNMDMTSMMMMGGFGGNRNAQSSQRGYGYGRSVGYGRSGGYQGIKLGQGWGQGFGTPDPNDPEEPAYGAGYNYGNRGYGARGLGYGGAAGWGRGGVQGGRSLGYGGVQGAYGGYGGGYGGAYGYGGTTTMNRGYGYGGSLAPQYNRGIASAPQYQLGGAFGGVGLPRTQATTADDGCPVCAEDQTCQGPTGSKYCVTNGLMGGR